MSQAWGLSSSRFGLNLRLGESIGVGASSGAVIRAVSRPCRVRRGTRSFKGSYMAQESLPPPVSDKAERPRGPGRIAIAGMFGACALGGGLGLWARPAPPEAPAAVAETEPPRPTLQVVVDDTPPSPAGALLEVLPADLAATPRSNALPRLIPVEPLAPRAAGLVRVDAVVAPATAPPPAPIAVPAPASRMTKVVEPAREPAARPKALKVQAAKPAATTSARVAKVEKAVEKARRKEKAAPPPTRVAKAGKAKPSKAALAKAPRAKARPTKLATSTARASRLKPTKPRCSSSS